MTIKPLSEMEIPRKLQVNLAGPLGNAFALLGMAKGWSRQTGKDFNAIKAEMISGDYENLLAVLDREFGDVVDFYR